MFEKVYGDNGSEIDVDVDKVLKNWELSELNLYQTEWENNKRLIYIILEKKIIEQELRGTRDVLRKWDIIWKYTYITEVVLKFQGQIMKVMIGE